MRELYERDRLAAALRDARERTLSLYAHLDDAALEIAHLEIVNPPLWELSHIAWFQEFWCRRYRANDPAGERVASIIPDADRRFNSAIAPHRDRWEIARIPRSGVVGYLRDALQDTLEELERSPKERRYFFRLALLHEDMHGEALLMTLQTLGLPPPELASLEPPVATVDGEARDVAFAGGEFVQGSDASSPDFVWDNERLAHRRKVAPFAMAQRTVTQGEYARFVNDGGYAREQFWSPEGRAWRLAAAADAPRYWRREGRTWQVRRYDQWLPLDESAPMIHVTLHEAEAYCAWAGRRLPTESEWEFAARGGTERRFPWGDAPAVDPPALDYRHRGPSAALADPAQPEGLRQMLGGVWEWTATPFGPYDGFRADPYKEYSEPWFHNHQVLRGGSFATRSRLVHNRWRNFYQAHRNDAFTGFRTCPLEP